MGEGFPGSRWMDGGSPPASCCPRRSSCPSPPCPGDWAASCLPTGLAPPRPCPGPLRSQPRLEHSRRCLVITHVAWMKAGPASVPGREGWDVPGTRMSLKKTCSISQSGVRRAAQPPTATWADRPQAGFLVGGSTSTCVVLSPAGPCAGWTDGPPVRCGQEGHGGLIEV